MQQPQFGADAKDLGTLPTENEESLSKVDVVPEKKSETQGEDLVQSVNEQGR